jgi:hypothetical protein
MSARMALTLGAVAAVLALAGCETTMQRSAELERRAHHISLQWQGVSVTRESPNVQVLQSTIVRGGEASAVVVLLRNTSSHPLRDAPVEITVRDAKGAVLYRNDSPGLDFSLTHVPLLMPGAQTQWVDDQVQLTGTAAETSALVGEARPVPGAVPRLVVSRPHQIEEPSLGVGAAGAVANRSNVTQRNLVVYAVARRGGRVVAAGRAVIPEAPAGGSSQFQAFFIGDPHGAEIQASAPPTTFY